MSNEVRAVDLYLALQKVLKDLDVSADHSHWRGRDLAVPICSGLIAPLASAGDICQEAEPFIILRSKKIVQGGREQYQWFLDI